jgi:NAD(P)-dependent dehydrogenase (short-subunit alcohol dehydrogenase family)
MDWTGKTALITGGVSGIGFGIARAFCAAGIDLVLTWRNRTYRTQAEAWFAEKGYAAQQSRTPASGTRRDNLWQPIDRDFGAHGRFDSQARRHSLHLWCTTHRRSLALGGLAGLAATIWRWNMTRSSSAPAPTALLRRSS